MQKILAGAGVASRRAAERLIQGGAITVNGAIVTELGTRADPTRDDIRVSGQRIGASASPVYYILHKPAGYVTTVSDEHGRAAVLDLMSGVRERVFPVGRLDRDSEGLLLLTNDGDLTVRLTHPRYGVEKEYAIQVDHTPDKAALETLRRGVVIEGRHTGPAQVETIGGSDDGAWLQVTMQEGRKRQLRLMCEAVGLRVRRLVRMRVGPITLGDLPPGRYRQLAVREVNRLRAAVGL